MWSSLLCISLFLCLLSEKNLPKALIFRDFQRLSMCMRLLLVAHPAERHTAAVAGATALCDAARCFPAASGDAEPRGWCPVRGGLPWSSLLMPLMNRHFRGLTVAAVCPVKTCHPGLPVKVEKAKKKKAQIKWFEIQKLNDGSIGRAYTVFLNVGTFWIYDLDNLVFWRVGINICINLFA